MSQKIKVFAIGKGILKDAEDIKQLAELLKKYSTESMLILVDSIAGTTRELEEVVDAYFKQTGTAFELFERIKQRHYKLILELFPKEHEVFSSISDSFMEIEWVIEDDLQDEYDYLYDQIVSMGAMIASQIIVAYFKFQNLATQWLDARDAMLTDNTYRAGNIIWETTRKKMDKFVLAKLQSPQFIVSQNNFGGTSENFTTTFGKHNTIYTATVFANCLNATTIFIYKKEIEKGTLDKEVIKLLEEKNIMLKTV